MRPFILPIVLVALAACAKTPLSTEASAAAIRGAQEAGAREVPEAALHVQLARENQRLAEDLAEDGEAARAKSLLLRATADAELAVALAHADAAKQLAAAAAAKTLELQKENVQP